MNEIKERGYAKINLHLDIVGRLEGGYHRVETVMQTVSLFDTLTLTRKERGDRSVTLDCNVAGVPTDGRNLAVRAALLLLERVGAETGVHISIDKQIPMAAGMAGGSADGAAALRGLNRLLGEPLNSEALCALGATLGADVPFCVVGGTAFADGRGDCLHSFAPMPDCHLVVACEGEGVSTPWAYGLLDRRWQDFSAESTYRPRSVEALRAALTEGDLEATSAALYNVFEEPILGERPVAADVRRRLLEAGALGAMMSGSGPSVFGIFDSEAAAARGAEALTRGGYRAYRCRPCGL